MPSWSMSTWPAPGRPVNSSQPTVDLPTPDGPHNHSTGRRSGTTGGSRIPAPPATTFRYRGSRGPSPHRPADRLAVQVRSGPVRNAGARSGDGGEVGGVVEGGDGVEGARVRPQVREDVQAGIDG